MKEQNVRPWIEKVLVKLDVDHTCKEQVVLHTTYTSVYDQVQKKRVALEARATALMASA